MRNKQEIIRGCVNSVIKMFKDYIGCDLSEELVDIMKSVIKLLGEVYNLDNKSLEKIEYVVFNLFSINQISDYYLILKDEEILDQEILNYSDIYINELAKKNNAIYHYNHYNLKRILDLNTGTNNLDAFLLKACLLYLGIIYPKDLESALFLLEICAYSGDIIAFDVLYYITKNAKYSDLKNNINIYYNNLFAEKVLSEKDYNWVLIYEYCYKAYLQEHKIDIEMFKYLYSTTHSPDVILKNIKNKTYKLTIRTHSTKLKLGF